MARQRKYRLQKLEYYHKNKEKINLARQESSKKYRDSPEGKAKIKKYTKKYWQKPEVKAKSNARRRKKS